MAQLKIAKIESKPVFAAKHANDFPGSAIISVRVLPHRACAPMTCVADQADLATIVRGIADFCVQTISPRAYERAVVWRP
jgi:hypothetical protein